MKTALLIILCAFTQVLHAKTKPDTTKHKYDYFVKIPVGDYQQLVQALNAYRSIVVYDPNSTDAHKVKLIQGIEQYLRDLPSRVKIDSVNKAPKMGKP
ncbi:MAG: hypothetical protein JWQ66_2943 [Mucilaginibacter sp.]|nr:hypothetical protein [Mucilaginibacter sp.]